MRPSRRLAWRGWLAAGVVLCGVGRTTVAFAGTDDVATDRRASVQVGSVNMWGIPYVSTHIDARFAALAERIRASDLDLIGIQEAWADGPRRALCDRLATEYPYRVDFHSRHGESGLVIVSRFPIIGDHYTPFPVNGKPWKPWHGDWWGGKGIGVVHVQSPAGPFWFATTHLHARYAGPGAPAMREDEYVADRWTQVHTVHETLARLTGEEPAVIVGDFNFQPHTPFYRFLSDPGRFPWSGLSPSPWVDAAVDRAAEPTARRIDYVWLKAGTSPAWEVLEPAARIFADPVLLPNGGTTPLSDHPAIAARVVLVPSERSVESGASDARVYPLPAPRQGSAVVSPGPAATSTSFGADLWTLPSGLNAGGQFGEALLLTLGLCAPWSLGVWLALRRRRRGLVWKRVQRSTVIALSAVVLYVLLTAWSVVHRRAQAHRLYHETVGLYGADATRQEVSGEPRVR